VDTVPIFVCYGFSRSAKEGCIVSVWVDDEPVTERFAGVTFMSNPGRRKRESWWGGSIDLFPGSAVRVETKVGVRGSGPDTERTTCQSFLVDAESDLTTVALPRVGYRHYPLLKGRLRPYETKSQHDDVLASVDAAIEKVEHT
jgi:hypothetical protein